MKGFGNIYQTNSWANPGDAHWIPLHSDTTQMEGWHVVDTLKALDDKLQVTLGVHGHRATVNQVGETSLKSRMPLLRPMRFPINLRQIS